MADTVLPKTRHDLPGMPFSANPVIQQGVLRVTCCECGQRFSKPLTSTEKLDVISMYKNNGIHPKAHVQTVFSKWTDDERELFLLSHLCDKCWKKIMSGGEEE